MNDIIEYKQNKNKPLIKLIFKNGETKDIVIGGMVRGIRNTSGRPIDFEYNKFNSIIYKPTSKDIEWILTSLIPCFDCNSDLFKNRETLISNNSDNISISLN